VVDLERHVARGDHALRRPDDADAGPGDLDDGALADAILEALDGDEVAVREDDDVVRERRHAHGRDSRAGDHGDADGGSHHRRNGQPGGTSPGGRAGRFRGPKFGFRHARAHAGAPFPQARCARPPLSGGPAPGKAVHDLRNLGTLPVGALRKS
jgi:hypothetical protein